MDIKRYGYTDELIEKYHREISDGVRPKFSLQPIFEAPIYPVTCLCDYCVHEFPCAFCVFGDIV